MDSHETPTLDLAACIKAIQLLLPPGASLTVQASSAAPGDPAAKAPPQEPREEDLISILNPLSAAEVRYLAKANRKAVTDAIAIKELPTLPSVTRQHQIHPKDAMSWVAVRANQGFLAHRTLRDVWRFRNHVA